MLHIEKWKVVLTAILCVLGVVYTIPNLLPEHQQQWLAEKGRGWLPHKTVSLGLDLQGGSHLLLEADIAPVIKERMESMEADARSQMSRRIRYTELRSTAESISFRLSDVEKDEEEALKIARGLDPQATVNLDKNGVVTVKLEPPAMKEIKDKILEKSIEIVRRRVDETGTKEPVIQRQGENRIVVQLPGLDDPARIKKLLGATAKMSFHLIDENATNMNKPTASSRQVPMRDNPLYKLFIKRKAEVSGERLIDSQPSFDQTGAPVVTFRFDSLGAKQFCAISKENVGKPFAILLELKKGQPEIISAPRINEPICGGSGQISGGFDVKEASDLALLLRAGALPAELDIVEERTVGPTLGSDSVASGKIASVIAFGAVIVLMFLSYGLFGMFANIALTFNVFFIFALLSAFEATLTLPGIAAIVLTIGIAVDANVLVYERIREELRSGRSIISSVDTGYRHALRTIMDSNLTTLLVAIILFSFGSGPIKGFAVAMCIGTVTSLFACIMITRLLIAHWLRTTKPSKLYL